MKQYELTTAHSASSYGQPVAVDADGTAHSWHDLGLPQAEWQKIVEAYRNGRTQLETDGKAWKVS